MARKEESKLRSAVKAALRPLHVVPVENGETDPGTPDVNYAGQVRWLDRNGEWGDGADLRSLEGWIELKLGHFQKRETSRLAVTVQPGQKPWWETRSRAGGRIHILIQCDDPNETFMWLTGDQAVRHLGTSSPSEIRHEAGANFWYGKPDRWHTSLGLDWPQWLRTRLLL